MDWLGVIASESIKEEEMSILAAEFTARIRKRIVNSKDELAPTSDGKRPRQSSSDEEA